MFIHLWQITKKGAQSERAAADFCAQPEDVVLKCGQRRAWALRVGFEVNLTSARTLQYHLWEENICCNVLSPRRQGVCERKCDTREWTGAGEWVNRVCVCVCVGVLKHHYLGIWAHGQTSLGFKVRKSPRHQFFAVRPTQQTRRLRSFIWVCMYARVCAWAERVCLRACYLFILPGNMPEPSL